MKYIRTKDGIWQLDNLDCIHHPYNNMPIHKSYLEIIKQANTIEELCDVLVVIKQGESPKIAILNYLQELKDLKEEIGNRVIIYGAIWTDKGLIYVAKMNEKGELELL